MKHIFTALFLTLLTSAYGQWDVVLDPIETETIQPSSYELQNGNWTPVFHQISTNKDYIKSHAKRKVVVFVHDTGGAWDNKYLDRAGKNLLGKSYTGEALKDGHGHSTHVAGCIAAYSPDFPIGTAGDIADYIWLIPHKVLTNQGSGQYAWILESLKDAYEDGLKYQKAGMFVIHNLSLGGGSDYQPITDIITKCREAGQLVFIAAGNTGNFPIEFPGRATGANAIGAIDQMGNRASFSSWGNEMFITGGGVSVLSTMPNDQLAKLSGTSMATPTMAGIAAVIACTNPTATANQIERFLIHYASDISPDGWDNKTGYGTVKYNDYIGKSASVEPDTPLNSPDPPVDTIPTLPEREERFLTFYLPTYTTIWKTASGPEYKKIAIDLQVSINTKLYDADAYDAVKKEFDWFFCKDGSCGRGFVLLDQHGFKDAGYFAGYFAEMIINRRESKLGVKVQFLTVTDDKGRTAEHKRQTGEKLSTKMSFLGLRALKPYTLIYGE